MKRRGQVHGGRTRTPAHRNDHTFAARRQSQRRLAGVDSDGAS